MNFNELKLKKEIIDAINEVNYSSMTLIQENVLEKSINGIDILAQSPTGTGKTLCFVLPILNKVNFSTNSQIQAVIIVPTRELVLQIHSDFLKFGKNIKNLNIIQIYGGQKIFKQINHLKSMPQIAIFTPGRFVDHIKRKTIDLSNVSTLVLDEVDEMFDMGFKRDIEFIIGNINTKHQTIMITATLNNEVEIASKKFQSNPYKYIDLNSQSRKVNNNIEQHFIRVNDKNKIGVLEKIIKDNNFFVAIIFVNTINTAK
jgi:ATP-dependent RNA helicase DeaD